MDFLGLTTLTVIHDARADDHRAHAACAVDLDALALRRRRDLPHAARAGAPPACSSSSRRSPPTCCAACAATASTTSSRRTRCCARARSTPACTTSIIRRKRGRGAGHLPAPRARGDPRADLRRHHLSGTGDAHRAACWPGISLAEADVLRKAVGKKDAELIKKELGKFVDARPSRAATIRSIIDELAGADRDLRPLRLQQVALGRLLGRSPTRPPGSRRTTRPSSWPRCCRRKSATPTRWCSTSTRRASSGIEVLPPDVNESGFKFTVVGDKRIRFGLGAVRNVGPGRHRVDHRGARRRAVHARCATLLRAHRPARSATSACSRR